MKTFIFRPKLKIFGQKDLSQNLFNVLKAKIMCFLTIENVFLKEITKMLVFKTEFEIIPIPNPDKIVEFAPALTKNRGLIKN